MATRKKPDWESVVARIREINAQPASTSPSSSSPSPANPSLSSTSKKGTKRTKSSSVTVYNDHLCKTLIQYHRDRNLIRIP